MASEYRSREAPPLSEEQIEELTRIVFLDPVEPKPCDLILVFGGTHPGAWETAADAWHKGLGKRVLVMGGVARNLKVPHATWHPTQTPICHVIADHLKRLGVPADRITCDERPTNSLEEVLCAKETVESGGIASVLFVSKCFGAGRQYRTLRMHLPEHIALVPYPFDTNLGAGPVVTRNNWMDRPESRSVVYSEYLRILRYGAQGDLVPLDTPITAI